MLKIMSAPGRYIQDYNIIKDFASHVSRLGSRPFILGGKTALSQVQDRIMQGVKSCGLECSFSVSSNVMVFFGLR